MGSPAWHASSYRINRRDGFRCVDPSSHRVPYMETLCPIRVYKQETIAYMEAMPTRMITGSVAPRLQSFCASS